MADARLPALRTIALVILTTWGSVVHAAGLGPVRVQSSLGQPLLARVPILGGDAGNIAPNCVKASVEGTDGGILASAQASVIHGAQGSFIRVTTNQSINEPAAALQIHVTCGTSIHRVYQVLLDPVTILPQVAQIDDEPVPSASQSRASRVNAVVSSEATSRNIRLGSRFSSKKGRSEVVAPTHAQVEATNKKLSISREMRRKKVVRNVLRLSGDDAGPAEATFSPGLKLSDTLSESRDTGDPQKAAELKAAYERFQAAMRDEDLIQKGEAQVSAMQSKLQEMEKEVARLKHQSQEDRVVAEDLRKSWFSPTWISWFVVLLLGCLGAIGWLIMRLKESKKRPAFWEETEQVTQTDTTEDLSTISANWDDSELAPDSMFSQTQLDENTRSFGKGGDLDKDVALGEDTLAMGWATDETTIDPNADIETKLSEPTTQEPIQQRKSFPPIPAKQEPPEFLRKSASDKNADSHNEKTFASAGFVKPAPIKADEAHQFKVEEVSDLLQEAEFWMLLNDPRRAIDILQPYSEVEKPVSPVPWIYLLDMYRIVEEQDRYEALKAHSEKVFNAKVPSWEEEPDSDAEQTLADYPHVVQAIQDLWEGDYIVPYLESLLFDEREGDRAGFDLSVYREIIHLISVARDPEAKRNVELNFGKTQPRLISQQVRLLAKKSDSTASAAENSLSEVKPLPQSAARMRTAEFELLHVDTDEVVSPSVAPVSSPKNPHNGGLGPISTTVPTSVSASPEASRQAPAALVPEATVPPSDRGAPAKAAPTDLSAANTMKASGDEDGDDQRTDMARKLDLAVAYQEIGENVGARVLLEEVIQGGTELQVEKAKGMLKKLLKEIDWQ